MIRTNIRNITYRTVVLMVVTSIMARVNLALVGFVMAEFAIFGLKTSSHKTLLFRKADGIISTYGKASSMAINAVCTAWTKIRPHLL